MIGGFYHIDIESAAKEPVEETFCLRCDTKGVYNRKIYTGNGRTATSYILFNSLDLAENDVILLPDYVCISVINSFEVCPAKFRYYKVCKDLSIDIEDLLSKIDEHVKVIYVIHYFGFPQQKNVVNALKIAAQNSNIVIIEDITQALYTKDQGRIGFGDYIVASTRKWMAVTDGGLLAIKDGISCPDAKLADAYDEAVYRQLIISVTRDYYDRKPDKDISYYLQMEKQANAARYLDFTPRAMTELSRRVMFNMDHEYAARRRRENYMYLYEKLKDINGLKFVTGSLDDDGKYVPFGMMLLTDDRDSFYRYLTEHRIIPEIQWLLATDYYTPGAEAAYLSEHNLMLQCDQRYDENDMSKVVHIVKDFFS